MVNGALSEKDKERIKKDQEEKDKEIVEMPECEKKIKKKKDEIDDDLEYSSFFDVI